MPGDESQICISDFVIGLGQVTKVRFAFLTSVTWPRPRDESQICFSDFRHLAQARRRKSDLLFSLSLFGIGQVMKVRFAFLTFVTWPRPGDESQICFSDFRSLVQTK
jgi:hypothetical protein